MIGKILYQSENGARGCSALPPTTLSPSGALLRWRKGWLQFVVCLLAVLFFGRPELGVGQTPVSLSGGQNATATYPYHVLQQHRVSFGQHSITFNRVAPPVFSAVSSTSAPAIPAWIQNGLPAQFLFFSANVHDHQLSVVQSFQYDAPWLKRLK